MVEKGVHGNGASIESDYSPEDMIRGRPRGPVACNGIGSSCSGNDAWKACITLYCETGLQLVEVYKRMYITWKSPQLSGNDNTEVALGSLDGLFDKNYLVWRFVGRGEAPSGPSGNVVMFPPPEYSVSLGITVSKSVKGWLDLFDKHVAVLESPAGNAGEFVYVVCCVIKYLCSFQVPTAISAISALIGRFANQSEVNIIKRHMSCFDKVVDKSVPALKHRQLYLYQMIVSSRENMVREAIMNYRVEVYQDGTLIHVVNPPSGQIYHDDYYLIFFFNMLKVNGDVEARVCFRDAERSDLVSVTFNTFFYDHGMFRLERDEVKYDHSTVKTDFTVDLVLKADPRSHVKYPYNDVGGSAIENVRVLVLHSSVCATPSGISGRATGDGLGQVVSSFLFQTGKSAEEVASILRSLKLLGEEEIRDKTAATVVDGTRCADNMTGVRNGGDAYERCVCNEVDQGKGAPDGADLFGPTRDDSTGDCGLNVLDPIPHSFSPQGSEGDPRPKRRKKPPTRLKVEKGDTDYPMPHLFSQRPIYVSEFVSSSKKNIFSDLDSVDANFDVKKFEDWFCGPCAPTISNVCLIPERAKGRSDNKRLLLMQLSIKALEKKKIDPMDLPSTLLNRPEALEIEDLVNVNNLLLKGSDLVECASLRDGSSELSHTEKVVAELNDSKVVKCIIPIMLFDKRFWEESSAIMRMLQKYNRVLSFLDSNNVVKIILKYALEIVNAINFTYTTNKKKYSGIAIESLNRLCDYKGRGSDQTLINFIVDALLDQSDVILSELEVIESFRELKGEDLNSIREKINGLVIDHGKCVDIAKSAPLDDAPRIYIVNILKRIFKALKLIYKEYEGAYELSARVKSKYLSANSTSLGNVLDELYKFVKKIKDGMEKRKVTGNNERR